MRKNYSKKYLLLCAFLMMSVMAFAQTGSIKGKVVDESNQPLPGASVSIDGTTHGSVTDANGSYTISGLTPGNYTLTAKFVGYIAIKKSITVSNSVSTADFGLKPESTNLNEVVVIGYGTEKKKDLTGSIATVTAKDFNQGAITTPEQLIQGKVAGVQITSNSGAPGSGSTIRIRSGASLNGSSDPLIVIDGVPLSNDVIAGAANPLSLINPNDIESFSILKDASAAAIYGNRASNGVILITTKKGKAGKPVINFSTQFSVSKLPKEAPVLSPSQFRDYVNTNDTTSAGKYKQYLGSANTDWQKVIYQTALSTDNNLSVAGTTIGGKLPYRVSAGYTDQDGILKTTSLQRYSANVNLSPSLFTDHLKINFNFIGSQVKQRFANEGGAIGSAVDFNPTVPVYSGNNNYGGYYEILSGVTSGTLVQLAPKNPLGVLEEENNRSTVYRAITSLALDYKFHFLPDLHANVNLSYDGNKGQGIDDIPAYAASQYPGTLVNGVTELGKISNYQTTADNKLFEGYLSYSKDFKSIKSHVDAVAGYSDQTFTTDIHNYANFFADGKVNPTTVPTFPLTENQFDMTSVYARLNYNYDGKYYITGSVRSDVSTKFAPGLRTGTFPAGAVAWAISHEDFLKNNSVLSNLKLRVEYGVTGNQDAIPNAAPGTSLGDYDYLSDYSLSNATAQYQFGTVFYPLYRPGAYYPGRTWEQTATTNVGFDYGFLNDRITGTIDYYYRKTKNLLALENQPAGANFGNQIVGNIGNMQDKGLEFASNAKIINNKDFGWDANFNFTLDRNKITNLTAVANPNFQGLQTGGISGGTGNFVELNQVGYPKNSFYVYQQVYGPNGKPLDGVFVDRNHDGIINNKDLYEDHSPDPKEYMGFSSDFRYKKWNLGFVARAELGNYAYNNVASNTGIQRNILNPLGIINNGSSDVLTSGLTGNGSNDLLSDYYIQNASFFRMDNIHLGYNFGKVFKNTGILKVSANVQNVFIITKYKGVDPELPAGGTTPGIDNNFYPRPRTFVLGLNLSL
jgi:TonB-linked SusC/RagA family outer membrane protein